MSFRRIPFQFSSTDPAERQAELEKRFGLPSRNNMYVDVASPLGKEMGTSNRDFNLSSSSPRLQHRVPIFVEGYDQPVKSSVDSMGNFDAKKPNVRVIPIEIEGDPLSSNRHRTFSGPAGWANKEESLFAREDASPLKRSMQDLSQPLKVKAATGPKVHNIPIHVEGRIATMPAKVSKSGSFKDHTKINGCVASKPLKVKSPEKAGPKTKPIVEPAIDSALKKIEKVLEELKPYESGVQEFVGTVKDKQYIYLDEMLTRLMLKLDDVETMGNDEVRSARKGAIKKVQSCIDLLETKINVESANGKADVNLDDLEVQDIISLSNDIDMKEIEDNKVIPESSGENAVEMAEIKDNQCEEIADTKQSNEITELEMTELQEKILDSQTEEEMEEKSSSEKEAAITVSTEVIGDISNKDGNGEIPEVEMVEGKPVESLSGDETLNEAPKVDLSQNITHSDLLEEKSAKVELSNKSKFNEICCQSLDNSTACDVNIVPKVTTDTTNAQSASAVQNIEISECDQISTEL